MRRRGSDARQFAFLLLRRLHRTLPRHLRTRQHPLQPRERWQPVCTGVFTFYDGKAHFDFANHAALDSAAARHGMGFQQILILRNDSVVSSDSLQNLFRKSFVFRSLAEKDGKLCLVQSKDTLPYPQYVNLLAKAKVSNAIYLDMGGWSHGYYRDNFGKLQYLGEEPNPYSTNWILFEK